MSLLDVFNGAISSAIPIFAIIAIAILVIVVIAIIFYTIRGIVIYLLEHHARVRGQRRP